MSKTSWRVKLLILISIVFAVLFLFLFLYIYPNLRNEQIRMIQRNQGEVVFNITRQLEMDLRRVRASLMKIVELPEFSGMDIPGQQRIIADHIRFLQPVSSLHVIDAKGWFVSSSGDLSIHRGRSYTDQPFFTIPFEQGEIYFHPPRFFRTGGFVGTSVNVPIQSDTGKRVGVLSGGMRLAELITYVTEYPLAEGIVAFLVDQEGTVVAHSAIDLFALKEGPLSLNFSEQLLVQAIMAGKATESEEYDKEGTGYLGNYATLESSGWGVVAEIPMRLVLAESNAFAWRLTLVTVLVFTAAFLAILFFARQITEEQKQKEKTIRGSEKRYRTLFQGAAEGILVTDIETKKFKYANRAICKMLGYTEKELKGMSVADIHPKKSLAHVISEFEAQARGEKSLSPNIPCLRKDRTIMYADINSTKILIDEGERNVGFFTDVTERKKAEQEIEKERYNLSERVKELNCLYGISRLVEKEKISLEEILEGTVNLIPPSWQYPEITCARIVLESQIFSTNDFKETVWKQASDIVVHRKKVGTVEVFYSEEKPESDEGPFVKEERDLINAIAQRLGRIIERKKVEEEIESLSLFPSEDPSPVLRIGTDGKVLYVNDAAKRIFKFRVEKKVPEHYLAIIKRAISSKESVSFEEKVGARYFSSVIRLVPKARYLNMYSRDITERRKAEVKLKEYSDKLEETVKERTRELRDSQEELLRSERLATLGKVSGSISHELRNPLAVVGSSLYYLKTALKDADEKVQEHLVRIKSGVDRSTNIIESLLNLTQTKEPRLEILKLVDTVIEAVATSEIPAKVQVVKNFPDKDILVRADREQLQMVFHNIIRNMVQAMNGKGTLTAGMRRIADNWAEVSFADTGPGIAPELLDRIFEPLFSTKARGIGFGLSIAKMIIDKHGGTIEAKSEPKKGALLIVQLHIYTDKDKEPQNNV